MKVRQVKGLLISIYAILLLMFLILPQFKYSITYVQIIYVSIPFFGIFVFLNNDLRKRSRALLLTLVGIVFLRFLFNTPFSLNASMNTSIILYLCVLPFFIFEVVQYDDDFITAKVVAGAVIVMLLYIGIKTYRELMLNPTVARLLAHGTNDDENINLLRADNIGGFGFSYSIGMMVPYLATLFMQKKGGKKICCLIILIACFIYILYSQYTTLIFLSTLFLVYVLMCKNKNLILRILALIATLFVLLNLSNIFLYLSTHINLEALANHFSGIYISLTGGESESSRTELYINAFKLFLNSPIFGVDLTNEANSYVVSHAHSTFFAVLASGGIIGTVLFYYCFYIIIGCIKKVLGDISNIFPVFLMFFVLSIVNPISHFEICAVVFLLIPLLEYINRCKKMYGGN